MIEFRSSGSIPVIYSHKNMISKPCCRASTIEGSRSLLVLFAIPPPTTSVHVNLRSSYSLYLYYDYDNAPISRHLIETPELFCVLVIQMRFEGVIYISTKKLDNPMDVFYQGSTPMCENDSDAGRHLGLLVFLSFRPRRNAGLRYCKYAFLRGTPFLTTLYRWSYPHTPAKP